MGSRDYGNWLHKCSAGNWTRTDMARSAHATAELRLHAHYHLASFVTWTLKHIHKTIYSWLKSHSVHCPATMWATMSASAPNLSSGFKITRPILNLLCHSATQCLYCFLVIKLTSQSGHILTQSCPTRRPGAGVTAVLRMWGGKFILNFCMWR